MKNSKNFKEYGAKWASAHSVDVNQLSGFRFMQRLHPKESKKMYGTGEKYGPGILILYFKDDSFKTMYLKGAEHCSLVIQYLSSMNVPFINLNQVPVSNDVLHNNRWKGSSLYMLYFMMLFLIFLFMSIRFFTDLSSAWSYIMGIFCIILAIPLLYAQINFFCFIETKEKSMVVKSLFRTRKMTYKDIKKVNFDFSRLQMFTQVMEVLDINYNYHLYYIGRVPREELPALAKDLRERGIDATCSLNPDKWYYSDVCHTSEDV